MKWLIAFLLCGCAVPSKTEAFCFPKWAIRALTMFPLAFAATSSAQEITQSEVHVRCKPIQGESVCLIREADLDEVLAANARISEALVAALKQVEAMKASPKCAQIEVVPKKKIPLKRENDI